jgi:hypothetical protein
MTGPRNFVYQDPQCFDHVAPRTPLPEQPEWPEPVDPRERGIGKGLDDLGVYMMGEEPRGSIFGGVGKFEGTVEVGMLSLSGLADLMGEGQQHEDAARRRAILAWTSLALLMLALAFFAGFRIGMLV